MMQTTIAPQTNGYMMGDAVFADGRSFAKSHVERSKSF
jgi:hypothetical protein